MQQNLANIAIQESNWWKQNVCKISMIKQTSKNTLKKHIRKGIPNNLRSLVWPALINPQEFKYTDFSGKQEHYQCQLDSKRTVLRKLKRQDLQFKLKNVLNALANCFPDIGYFSGLNILISIPLLYCTEEQAFKIGCHLIKYNRFEKMTNTSQFIYKHAYILNKLIKKNLPQIYPILQKNQVETINFSPYFITLYMNIFPLNYSLRIFECYLLEGMTLIYQIVIEFLNVKSRGISNLQNQSQILSYMILNYDIDKVLVEDSLEKFLQNAFKHNVTEQELLQLEKQYMKQKSKKQAKKQDKKCVIQ